MEGVMALMRSSDPKRGLPLHGDQSFQQKDMLGIPMGHITQVSPCKRVISAVHWFY